MTIKNTATLFKNTRYTIVPDELYQQTELSIFDVQVYGRMMDDYLFFTSEGNEYRPAVEDLIIWFKTAKTTLLRTFAKLEKLGLMTRTSHKGWAGTTVMIDYRTLNILEGEPVMDKINKRRAAAKTKRAEYKESLIIEEVEIAFIEEQSVEISSDIEEETSDIRAYTRDEAYLALIEMEILPYMAKQWANELEYLGYLKRPARDIDWTLLPTEECKQCI